MSAAFTGAGVSPARVLGPAFVFYCYWNKVGYYLLGGESSLAVSSSFFFFLPSLVLVSVATFHFGIYFVSQKRFCARPRLCLPLLLEQSGLLPLRR